MEKSDVLNLRDYQRKAVNAVFAEWESSESTLVVSPTGTGKTILMCAIVQGVFPRRVMILAHREELIFQARDKVMTYTGISADIEMADQRVDENVWGFGRARVVVSSIQTQNAGGDGLGRMGKFNPMDFSVLIVDEAHHAVADSYRRVLDYYRTNPDLRILGVTATPDRADESALGQVFDSVAFDYEIIEAIHDGYLVPIRQRMIEVQGLDYSSIRTTAGDLNGADLRKVMETEANLHGIASPILEIAGTRKTLVFASSVDHAERLSEIFNRHRDGMSGWICGKTPKDERRDILTRFAAGALQFVVNVGCLTEGFDDPSVEVVAIARPTKSRCLYAQMCGRGTRPLHGLIDGLGSAEERLQAIAASGKPSVEILDFVGNAGRHKLMTTADILGGKSSDEAMELAVRKVRESGAPVDMEEILEESEREIQERKDKEAARRAKLQVRADWDATTVDPFDVFHLSPRKAKGWEQGKELSPKQADVLRKQGIDPEGKPYHEMKQVLDEIFRRWDDNQCSFKQAKHLQRYGLNTDVSVREATMILDGIWKAGKPPQQAFNDAKVAMASIMEAAPF